MAPLFVLAERRKGESCDLPVQHCHFGREMTILLQVRALSCDVDSGRVRVHGAFPQNEVRNGKKLGGGLISAWRGLCNFEFVEAVPLFMFLQA